MSAAPYPWIKQLESAVKLMQEIPLWGNPPPFPWEECTRSLQNAWNLPNLRIVQHEVRWRSEEQLLEGLGTAPGLTCFSLIPLKGKAFLAMSAEDRSRLTKSALVKNTTTTGFTDKRIEQGFYTYMLLEGLHSLGELQAFGDLVPVMDEDTSPLEGGAVGIDLQLEIKGHSIWARLLCSEELFHAFKHHFIEKTSPFSLHQARNFEIPLRFEVGSTALSLSKWEKVKAGDLLLLDRCTYDPKSHKGSAEIVCGKIPLLRVRLKEGVIKILDYAFYFEEETPAMDHDEDEDEFFLEDDEDEEFEDEDSEEEEIESEEEEEEKEDPGEEDTDQDTTQEEPPLWKAENKSQKTEMTGKIASSKIPLTITVEVARLDMSIEKLLQLTPGNELPLPVHPEQGVHLLINGKRIAKGELIKIGETLGVRILQLEG